MSRLALLPELVSTWTRYNLLQPLRGRPFLPRMAHVIPSHRCNARCVMCGLWQDEGSVDNDLTLEQWRELLADRLFSRLQFVGISGGEPFLRGDLAELAALFVERTPGLKRVSITTNGLLPGRTGRLLDQLAGLLGPRGILLDISVSFHAAGPTLDRIFGVEGAFDNACRTLELLRERRQRGQLTCSLNCVLLRDNIEEAPDLLRWAREHDLPLSFVLGEERERFHNTACGERFLAEGDRGRLIAFIRSLADDFPASPSAVKYGEILRMLEEGRERTLSCYYAFAGVLLGNDGTLYYCSHCRGIGNALETPAHELFYGKENLEYRKERLINVECRHCPPYTLTRLELEKDILKVAGRALRGKGGRS